jgi:hypothetical protein
MNIEVSLGEAIDKLSILDIKSQKIKDEERLKYVIQEKEYLNKCLGDIFEINDYYYKILYETNLKIWELQDNLRTITKSDSTYSSICEEIIHLNDSRFLIKNKVNKLTNSKFQEQKGYSKRIVYYLSHLGLGDNISMIGCVRFLSLFYDEINVICKKHNDLNVKMFYKDDPSIKTVPIVNDIDIETTLISDFFKKHKCYENADIFISGFCHTKYFKSKITHPFFKNMKYVPNPHIKYDHIKGFYSDINLDANIYHEYFYLPRLNESKEIYEKISDKNIIFCHTTASNSRININIDLNLENTIVVNPNVNMYGLDHKNYELAESFLNRPLLHFVDIILNANVIKIIDSSFCCMILPLSINNKLKCKNIEVINR